MTLSGTVPAAPDQRQGWGAENLATLRELAESEKVTPVIDRTYPLSQAPEAIRYLEAEHARAKVALTV